MPSGLGAFGLYYPVRFGTLTVFVRTGEND